MGLFSRTKSSVDAADRLIGQLDEQIAGGATVDDIRATFFSDDGELCREFSLPFEREQFVDLNQNRLRRALLWAEINTPVSRKSLSFTARDAMTTGLVTVTRDTVIHAAQKLLIKHRVSGLPVVDQNERLVGLLSESDILRFYASNGGAKKTVGDCMNSGQMVVVDEKEFMTTVVKLFAHNPIHRLPVVGRKKKLLGLISQSDVVRFIERLVVGTDGSLALA